MSYSKSNNIQIMENIKHYIPQFILGILFWIIVFWWFIYISWLWKTISQWHFERMEIMDKIDKLSIKIDKNTCNLAYWLQEKIEQTYENITSATCTINH